MDAGTTLSRSPWLTLSKAGVARISLRKSFNTGDHWRLVFKNPGGGVYHETPVTLPSPWRPSQTGEPTDPMWK